MGLTAGRASESQWKCRLNPSFHYTVNALVAVTNLHTW